MQFNQLIKYLERHCFEELAPENHTRQRLAIGMQLVMHFSTCYSFFAIYVVQ